MLEPTAIHSYEPPLYRVHPPSPLEGPPPSLPFACVILEAADAVGGPSPGLLHKLREQGCRLILAQFDEDRAHQKATTATTARPTAKLNREWYDAVFDKVLSLTGKEGAGTSPLERYLIDEGFAPHEALCFACSDAGAEAFSAADAGLIVAPSQDQVWRYDETTDVGLRMPGADVAAHESPTARQLAWLHTVFTSKLWCACVWLFPPPGEFKYREGSHPNALDRATLTAVRSPTAGALGHPAWTWRKLDDTSEPVCVALLGKETVACPDWTPLEPRFKSGRAGVQEISHFAKVDMYCHSLDVGVGEVNHSVEVVDKDGLRVRISSKRLASLARAGHTATELSVVVLEQGKKSMPDICIRSSLRYEQIPDGFKLKEARVDEVQAVMTATYADENKRSLTVTAWHRIVRDDGRGDVQVCLHSTMGSLTTRVEKAARHWGLVRTESCALDFIISNPSKGSRYTVEKVVVITGYTGEKLLPRRALRSSSMPGTGRKDGQIPCFMTTAPPMMAEIEEEHRSAWRAEWDRADIEVSGARRAMRFQRAVRLFRFHQVAQGDNVGAGKKTAHVPELVDQVFRGLHGDLIEEHIIKDRPSIVVTSRVVVHDPRAPPVMRIEPNVPPACERLQFNCALGGRWHRFTLTPGTVQILVQGPILGKESINQLYGNEVQMPPKFIIPTHESDVGVEVGALPWHEVHVQHAMTELGRPDGSAGGFYSLMRRTRFTRVEVLRRLLADWGPNEEYQAYNDETLTAPLRGALARLHSAPRPPGWRKGGNEDLHILTADASTKVRVLLQYEKQEMERDITFLEGTFTPLEGSYSGGEDICHEVMSIKEAKRRCGGLPGCVGFAFQGEPSEAQFNIHFRRSFEAGGVGWAAFAYKDGESALMDILKQQHHEKLCDNQGGSEAGEYDDELTADDYLRPSARDMVPGWDAFSERISDVLDKAARKETEDDKEFRPFRNFVTDRDGTVNNYCDRYSSSVQSAYNAAWLSHFARNCTDNAVFVTAAPLGGRPSAEGLMELCVAPRGEFTYSGSKGREYFDHNTARVLEAEELPQDQRELVDELHRRIFALCSQPGNTKFLGIGSGLQRKFGEITMARNDPAGTVPDPESRRFMAAVRRVKEELDPDGTMLDLHDTGTDMELFPRVSGGRASFDKGSGVLCLDAKLQLNLCEGPNIVCGDTGSDVPMVISTLRAMCGEKMVDVWQERMRKEDEPELPDGVGEGVARGTSSRIDTTHLISSSVRDLGVYAEGDETSHIESAEELEQKAREEAERRAREELEEEEAREAGSRLVVLFVVTPEAHEKNPKLVEKVRRWCDISGAHCVIVPSPDVLVAGLARYANHVARHKVIEADPNVPASPASCNDQGEAGQANGFEITVTDAGES